MDTNADSMRGTAELFRRAELLLQQAKVAVLTGRPHEEAAAAFAASVNAWTKLYRGGVHDGS
jgi:hypothetical protein